MTAIVEIINAAGGAFVDFALPMLVQSCVLILVLVAVDLVLRKRVRAVFRYCIWMLVLVKLVLPPSAWSPVSVGTWLGDPLKAPADALFQLVEPRPAGPAGESRTMAADILSQGVPAFTAAPVSPVDNSYPQSARPPERDNGWADPDSELLPGAAPVPSTGPALSWQGLVLLSWAAIGVALLLLLVQRAFFVRDLVADADDASAALQDELNRCRTQIGLRGEVTLKLSALAGSPAACGLIRPTILIPQSLASRLDSRALQAVLLHELAHVRRGDLWVNLGQTLLQILYFYNPLLWLANALIRRIREQAVDEMVLVAMGEAAPQYPETLVNIAKLALRKRPTLSLRLIGVVESKSALTARIKHMLTRPIPKTAKLSLLGMVVVVLAAVVLLPMAKAQPSPDQARNVTILAQQEPRASASASDARTKSSELDTGVGGGARVELGAAGQEPVALQGLIDEAQPGGVVMIPKGRYMTPVTVTKPLVLRGASREECVFEVTADRPAISINTKGKGEVTIENVTVRWQLATSGKVEQPYALAVRDANVVIRNCRFEPLGNEQRSPVAIRIDGFSRATVDNCGFSGFGYTVCYGPGSEGVVQDCVLTDPGHQGVTNYENSTLRVQRTIVIGSKYHGVRCTGGTLDVKDCLLVDNRISGIYLGNKDGQGTIANNVMLRNMTGVAGFYQSQYTVQNNVILDSTAAGVGTWDTCRLNILNNIFQGNTKALVVYPKGSKNVNIIGRNTFWRNAADTENCQRAADSIQADPRLADPDQGNFTAAGPAKEQGHGLTDPQAIQRLWPRYEQARAASKPREETRPAQSQLDGLGPAYQEYQQAMVGLRPAPIPTSVQ